MASIYVTFGAFECGLIARVIIVKLIVLHCSYTVLISAARDKVQSGMLINSAANRLIGEVVQSRKRPLLGPSPG